jgi:predicted small secreted protein
MATNSLMGVGKDITDSGEFVAGNRYFIC